MMKAFIWLHVLCSVAVLLSAAGCMSAAEEPPVPVAAASRVQSPITLDGTLSEADWSRTPGHEIVFIKPALQPRDAAVIAKDRYESAVFKMLYDDEYLYVGCTLEDADVFNDYTQNQTILLRGGDLFEFFIAPSGIDPTCYWEFYGAPNGLRSSYFYPSRGLVGIRSWTAEDEKNLIPGFEVRATVNGTLNDHRDADHGWTVEMRIPLKELEAKSGVRFAPGSRWRVQAARYNYGMQLNRVQNSAYPPLPALDYHLVEYFAPVEFR